MYSTTIDQRELLQTLGFEPYWSEDIQEGQEIAIIYSDHPSRNGMDSIEFVVVQNLKTDVFYQRNEFDEIIEGSAALRVRFFGRSDNDIKPYKFVEGVELWVKNEDSSIQDS